MGLKLSCETQQIGQAHDNLAAYYKGYAPYDEYKLATFLRTEQQIRHTIQALEHIGTDEVMLFTWSAEISQLDRLASII